MPQLTLGGVNVNVQEFSRQPDEQGGGDWRKRNWTAKVVLADDAAVATLRTALQSDVPRSYRRMINGSLRGGPLITCSGDRLGASYSCGVEIGEQPLEVTSHLRSQFHHTLTLTLREA
jgi:hypothetical protein